MVFCDECNAALEEGDEVFVFRDEADEFVFCSEVCAANFLCVVEAIDWDDEDEEFDEEDEEEDEIVPEFDLNIL